MSQAMVNFRMDEQLKKKMEATCKELGLSMTAAFTLFASKVAREKRIPFEIALDPFYSEKNLHELEERVKAIEAGNEKFVSHPLIED